MNAATDLLADLHRRGVRLSRNGDCLHVEAAPGAVTADLRDCLVANKPALLELLTPPTGEVRAHLLVLAEAEGVDDAHVHRLDDGDLAACVGCSDDSLGAFLRALVAGESLDAGQIPIAWGEPVAGTCEACGPVLLWAGCPVRVKACPWCVRRQSGKLIARQSPTLSRSD